MASGSTPTVSSQRGGGRAFGLGPRRRLTAGLGALALAAAIVVVILVATGSSGGSGRTGHSGQGSAASLKYGEIPSWLPKPTPPANQIVTATLAHPALAAVEGDTVEARLPSGSAMVTAVGPAIPRWVDVDVHSGHWNNANTAPTTFTVTFASRHGKLALKASTFSILTGQRQVIHPKLTAMNGSRPPAWVTPGKPVTVKLNVGLAEGDGALRWSPQGAKVLIEWLYQLEFD